MRIGLLRAAAAVSLACLAGATQAGPILNGDFETGNLSGWTVFSTTNGTNGTGFPTVGSYDTDNDGATNAAARFRVGKAMNGAQFAPTGGGGLFQTFDAGLGGTVDISAAIASINPFLFGTNAAGGLFELLLDGVVLDSHDFGPITVGRPEFDTLGVTAAPIAAGMHELRFRITRNFVQGDGSPLQYLDDVELSVTPSLATPEPTSIALLACGGLGLLAARRRKQVAA